MPTTEQEEKLVRYCNPGPVPTRVQTPKGDVTTLEPWQNHAFPDLRATRTFTLVLAKSFGDRLTRTGQLKPAPKDIPTGDGDESAQALMDARAQGIEEARRARAVYVAEQEMLAGDPMDRALEKLNNPRKNEDAPELDVEDAAPVVVEVRSGAAASGESADINNTGMSRKKKPKSQ